MRRGNRVFAFLTVLVVALPALAQESRCAVDPHDSGCPLDSTLNLLRVVAIVLAVVLVLIVGLAVAAYRKNRRSKLTPDD